MTTASFASQDWADALGTRLQGSALVRTESETWTHGPLAFLVDADAEHGVDATMLLLDVHQGAVRSVTIGDASRSALVPFMIGGSLAHWKAVFGGSLDLVDGILESKLRARGDLPTLVRHRGLLSALAVAGGELETVWQDEAEAAVAAR